MNDSGAINIWPLTGRKAAKSSGKLQAAEHIPIFLSSVKGTC